MLNEEKTIAYALAYPKIEKKNLLAILEEENISGRSSLIDETKKRLYEIDLEILEYRKQLHDTKIY